MHPKGHQIGYIVLTMLTVVLVASYFIFDLSRFASPTYVRELLLNAGIWGYFLFIIILLLSIPLPIPSTPIAFAGGYVYGIVVGTILALIAAIIGSTIQFYLVRRFGRPLAERFVHEHHLEHFEHLIQKRGISAALVSYAIPIFPSDAISLMLGLTPIRVHTLLLVVIFGSIPRYIIVNVLGNDIYAGFSVRTGIALFLMVAFILIAVFRERLKKLMFKELRELEREARKVGGELEQEVEEIEREVGIASKKAAGKKRAV